MQKTSKQNISTKQLVKGMLLMRDVSMTDLAEALNKHFGYAFTQSNLSRKLSADTVKWSELRDIAKLLGYSIKISPLENWESLEAYSPRKESAGITTVL